MRRTQPVNLQTSLLDESQRVSQLCLCELPVHLRGGVCFTNEGNNVMCCPMMGWIPARPRTELGTRQLRVLGEDLWRPDPHLGAGPLTTAQCCRLLLHDPTLKRSVFTTNRSGAESSPLTHLFFKIQVVCTSLSGEAQITPRISIACCCCLE